MVHNKTNHIRNKTTLFFERINIERNQQAIDEMVDKDFVKSRNIKTKNVVEIMQVIEMFCN